MLLTIFQNVVPKNTVTGEYYTYLIVESERIGDKVRQRTLLNLGKHFDIPCENLQLLIARIDRLISGQAGLFEGDLKQDAELEAAAHRYAAAILQKNAVPTKSSKQEYETVNVEAVEVIQPRSIGMETVAYRGIEQLDIVPKLAALGFNSIDTAAAIGNIIGRLVAPDSERSTLKWLQLTTSLTRFYEVTDKLLKNEASLEDIFRRE